MRVLSLHPKKQLVEMTPHRLARLQEFLSTDIEDGFAARQQQDFNWAECLRQYEGVPRNPIRNIPIENAPNYEVTLGAIASDSINAQAIDLVFNQVSPLVMARATRDDKELVDQTKAFHTWVNVAARTEFGVREATEDAALDWNQLGTGTLTGLWHERTKKTRVYKVIDVGAKVRAHPIEDTIVPGGSGTDIQEMPWAALRYYLTQTEMNERAEKYGWDTSGAKLVGMKGWVRSRREQLGRTMSSRALAVLYEVLDVYCYFDIDEDGLDEDLLVTWDRTGRWPLKVRYNPYDRRPIRAARYQKRAHLFYGLGVMEMMHGYQDELTDLHNDTATNSRLANVRMWKGRPNAVPGGVVRVFPNKYIETPDPNGFMEVKLSDVYPSAYRNESSIIAYAERRVGVRELSGPQPSKVLGGRTPGITALSVLQQINQRFAPAFDDLRQAIAGVIWECVIRYREQLLAGNKRAEKNIIEIMGLADAAKIVALLKSPRFEDSVSVEMTATTPMVNRAQERQDAMLLVQMLGGYYEKALELITIAANPQTPKSTQMVARQIAEKIGEVIERTVRTFDSVRDPSTFIIDMTEAIDTLPVDQSGLAGLSQLLGAQGGGVPQIGGAPAGGGALPSNAAA